MSTSILSTLYHAGLPIFTSLLGFLGLGSGIYNIISPQEGAKAFGLTTRPLPRTAASAHSHAVQQALTAVHGIRNIGSGLSLISLVLYWQFSSLCQNSPVAELAVRRCIGISVVLGPVVGLGDAWILNKFANAFGVDKEAKDLAEEKSIGHGVTALVIFGLGLAYLL